MVWDGMVWYGLVEKLVGARVVSPIAKLIQANQLMEDIWGRHSAVADAGKRS